MIACCVSSSLFSPSHTKDTACSSFSPLLHELCILISFFQATTTLTVASNYVSKSQLESSSGTLNIEKRGVHVNLKRIIVWSIPSFLQYRHSATALPWFGITICTVAQLRIWYISWLIGHTASLLVSLQAKLSLKEAKLINNQEVQFQIVYWGKQINCKPPIHKSFFISWSYSTKIKDGHRKTSHIMSLFCINNCHNKWQRPKEL
jgi:hypothetical protein